MALQDSGTCASEDVVNTSHTICTGRCKLVTSLIETGVKNFICVTSEFFNAGTAANVPQTRRSVDTAGEAVVAGEVELAAGELGGVAFQREEALAGADVPDLRRVVEGRRHEFVAVSIEVQGNDLCVVALEAENFLAGLNVPQLCRVIHGACGNEHTVWVER